MGTWGIYNLALFLLSSLQSHKVIKYIDWRQKSSLHVSYYHQIHLKLYILSDSDIHHQDSGVIKSNFIYCQESIINQQATSLSNVLDRPPVLEAHDVIENGVDGGTEVVEEARHMEQVPESGCFSVSNFWHNERSEDFAPFWPWKYEHIKEVPTH